MKPIFYIPLPNNRYFIGRRDELDRLRQTLIVNRNCQKMSIVGLGGTGKTQVALQFAYAVKETWTDFSIFWVPALSIESFDKACADVVKLLGIPYSVDEKDDAKELVKQHLSAARSGKWLLVVDNVDDADIVLGTAQSKGIVEYLPQSEEGVILFTTRTLEVAVSLTRSDVLELGPMNKKDASDFLEKSLIRKNPLENDAAMSELLDELAYLPLAIVQAAAYLNKNKMPIAKYVQLLHSTEQDIVNLMSREFRDDTRYTGSANAVATTWVVSFSQILTRNTVAVDLLFFISCIEWKAIPRSILPSVQSEVQMEDALGTLCGYSFLIKRGDEDWYDIHRLVHLAARIWTRQQGNTEAVVKKAIEHMAEIFPSDDFENRELWRSYMPHALRLLEDGRSWNVDDRSKLCLAVGGCLEEEGRIREAVRWLEQSCEQRMRRGEDNLDLLLSQHKLGCLYEADGQVRRAVELLEHVVAVQEKVLAEEHPSRLASQHELAGAYEADGQVKKAVELLENIVAVESNVLAEEHPDRLASQHALAIAYEADGQVKKAVELLEHVVAVQEKVLAEEHPRRLASQHELARAYKVDGQVQKAVELLEHVVETKKRVFRADHPSRLKSENTLRHFQANLTT